MKLNSYMRGLGIGIVVTALLMGVSNEPKPMTDEQIKIRARELGMVEKSEQVLSEVLPQAGSSKSEKDNTSSFDTAIVTPVEGEMPALKDNIPAGETAVDESIALAEEYIRTGDKADEAEDGQAPENKKSTSTSSEKQEIKSTSSSSKKQEIKSTSSSSEKQEVKSTSSSSEKQEAKSTSSSSEKQEAKSTSSSSEKQEAKSTSSSSEKQEAKSTSSSSEKQEIKNASSSSEKQEAKSTSSSSEKQEEKSTSSSSEKKENLVSGAAGTTSITITSGMSSTDVAAALQQAGVVASAAEFDKFLCANGYDRRIATGLKVIPQGASAVEIAGIITTR